LSAGGKLARDFVPAEARRPELLKLLAPLPRVARDVASTSSPSRPAPPRLPPGPDSSLLQDPPPASPPNPYWPWLQAPRPTLLLGLLLFRLREADALERLRERLGRERSPKKP
ncbi:unnamed protein product, partial [Polarella glacialis]